MQKAVERNVVILTSGLNALVRHPLSRAESQVLWHLASVLPIPGATVSMAELAVTFKLTPVHTTRAMKKLCEIGVLLRGPKTGVSYHYKLNPAFFRVLA